MDRKRMTWVEAYEYMLDYNREHDIRTTRGKGEVTIVAVIKDSSMYHPKGITSYTEEQRSYKFTNREKAFIKGMGCVSIFADCLDGSENHLRLDWCIPYEWEVEYCYILND